MTDASTRRYSRTDLLSLAQTPLTRPPAPSRLNSFSPILRRGSVDPEEWGVDESISSILDNKPISISLDADPPVLRPSISRTATSTSSLDSWSNNETGEKGANLIFAYQSAEVARPVMIGFQDPWAAKQSGRKASAVFQSAWSSANSSSTSLLLSNTPAAAAPGAADANAKAAATTLGEKFLALRTSSTSPSPAGGRSRTSSISSSVSIGGAGLNPFAPPFPLPSTLQDDKIPSLPLPRTLPSSVPKRPPGPIAPVFVKRESAALPQPMSLPDIAPLGSSWEGEGALSGNDRRRRASEMGLPALPIRLDGSLPPASSSAGGLRRAGDGVKVDQRPERLVKLGERLRQSIAEKGIAAK